jgi:hypothetical protein
MPPPSIHTANTSPASSTATLGVLVVPPLAFTAGDSGSHPAAEALAVAPSAMAEATAQARIGRTTRGTHLPT